MNRKRLPGVPAAALFVPGAAIVEATVLAQGAAAQATGSSPIIFLDQGWTPAERPWYYQVSQRSAVMFYDIFLKLDVAGSQALFRADVNSDHFGLITQPADPM